MWPQNGRKDSRLVWRAETIDAPDGRNDAMDTTRAAEVLAWTTRVVWRYRV